MLVGRAVGEVVRLGLEARVEGLARLRVERLPRLAVVGALQRPVARVTGGRVVGRGERVAHDRDRFGELELDPSCALEDEPLAVRRPVDEVLLDLAAVGVLAAGLHGDHGVGDVARDAGSGRSGDALRALGGVRPRRLRIGRLERRGEARRGGARRCRQRERAHHERERRPSDSIRHGRPSQSLRIPLRPMTTLSCAGGEYCSPERRASSAPALWPMRGGRLLVCTSGGYARSFRRWSCLRRPVTRS